MESFTDLQLDIRPRLSDEDDNPGTDGHESSVNDASSFCRAFVFDMMEVDRSDLAGAGCAPCGRVSLEKLRRELLSVLCDTLHLEGVFGCDPHARELESSSRPELRLSKYVYSGSS